MVRISGRNDATHRSSGAKNTPVRGDDPRVGWRTSGFPARQERLGTQRHFRQAGKPDLRKQRGPADCAAGPRLVNRWVCESQTGVDSD
jgi:hypothetical protein